MSLQDWHGLREASLETNKCDLVVSDNRFEAEITPSTRPFGISHRVTDMAGDSLKGASINNKQHRQKGLACVPVASRRMVHSPETSGSENPWQESEHV